MERYGSDPSMDNSNIHNLKSFVLLSKIIHPEDTEGNFPWAPAVWLVYHEAYRREIARVVRAVDSLKPLEDAWKTIALFRWITEFFVPILRHYEMGKRLYTKPYYEAKGHVIPTTIDYSEEFLHDAYHLVSKYAKDVMELSLSDNLFPKQIKDALHSLTHHIHSLAHRLNQHYDAEEVFWPAVFEQEGLDAWNKVLHRMLVHNRRVNTKISNHTFAMVFHAIGYNLKLFSPEDALDTPWCGPKTRYVFVKKAPFIVKALPLMKWMQDYLKYKNMITCIVFCPEDVHDYERRYRREIYKLQQQQVQRQAWQEWSERHWLYKLLHRYTFSVAAGAGTTHISSAKNNKNNNSSSSNTNYDNIGNNHTSNSNNTDNNKNIINSNNNTNNMMSGDLVIPFSLEEGMSSRSTRSHRSSSNNGHYQHEGCNPQILFAPEYQQLDEDDDINVHTTTTTTVVHKNNTSCSNNTTNTTTNTNSNNTSEGKRPSVTLWTSLFGTRGSGSSSSSSAESDHKDRNHHNSKNNSNSKNDNGNNNYNNISSSTPTDTAGILTTTTTASSSTALVEISKTKSVSTSQLVPETNVNTSNKASTTTATTTNNNTAAGDNSSSISGSKYHTDVHDLEEEEEAFVHFASREKASNNNINNNNSSSTNNTWLGATTMGTKTKVVPIVSAKS